MSTFIAPHFNLPFTLRQTADCVEQDTLEDVTNCVEMVLLVTQGQRTEAPNFGVSDYTFQLQPVSVDLVHDEIFASEPRADVLVTENPDKYDSLIEHLNVSVSTGGGQ